MRPAKCRVHSVEWTFLTILEVEMVELFDDTKKKIRKSRPVLEDPGSFLWHLCGVKVRFGIVRGRWHCFGNEGLRRRRDVGRNVTRKRMWKCPQTGLGANSAELLIPHHLSPPHNPYQLQIQSSRSVENSANATEM